MIILAPQDVLDLLLASFGVAMFAYVLNRILTFLPGFISTLVKRVNKGGRL